MRAVLAQRVAQAHAEGGFRLAAELVAQGVPLGRARADPPAAFVVDDVVEEVWYVVVALGRTLVWVVDRGRDGRLVRVAVGLLGGALAQTHAATAAEDELRGSDVGEVGSEAAGVTPADPARG